jgi:hypothetical protein
MKKPQIIYHNLTYTLIWIFKKVMKVLCLLPIKGIRSLKSMNKDVVPLFWFWKQMDEIHCKE